MKSGITVIRRLRKTDNLRVARACGATIVSRTEEITESDVGQGAGLFEVYCSRIIFICSQIILLRPTILSKRIQSLKVSPYLA